MPKVSVIMPAYNAEPFISEAINSVLRQTFTDFEFIIINDCSADRTADIVSSFQDSRITLLHNDVNSGIAATMNKGLNHATGTYIARLDHDDICLPDRLQKQVAFLDAHPEICAVGSAIMRFNTQGDLGTTVLPVNPKQAKVNLLANASIASPTVMLRGSVIRTHQLWFRSDYDTAEDYDLWRRLIKIADISNLPDVLLRYRMHGAQATQVQHTRQEGAATRIRRQLLDELVSGVTDETFDLYNQTMLGEKIADPVAGRKIRQLFREMICQNRHKRLYDDQTLRRKLALMHFYLSPDGIQPWIWPLAGIERIWAAKRTMRRWLK
ncbi:MAG: glycosyltransferase [Bacillota bacterium]|nr:glycosyltransferase [Bacillota bacterium]